MGKDRNTEVNSKRYQHYAQYRDAKGMTDYKISKECGIPRSTLSAWKTGLNTPKVDTLLKISHLLNVPLGDLIGG